MTQYSYQIGTSTASLTNLESMTPAIPPPKSTFTPYSQPLDLGDGTVRGAGWKTATWNFGFLTEAQRDKLRTYCTGAAANVYIVTRGVDNTDAYSTYAAVMIWPQEEEKDSKQVRTNFSLEFRKLVAA